MQCHTLKQLQLAVIASQIRSRCQIKGAKVISITVFTKSRHDIELRFHFAQFQESSC